MVCNEPAGRARINRPTRRLLVELTPAILLRKTKLTETSLIITWLSRDLGKLKTVAKGARRPKSKFSGVLDLFFLCEIGFNRRTQTDLHLLMEVSLQNPFEQLRFDYPRIALGAYFVELLDLVSEAEHPVPELFDLMERALAYLNRSPATKRALTHFEEELARLLGIHSTSRTAAASLHTVYHRLPAERTSLLNSLG